MLKQNKLIMLIMFYQNLIYQFPLSYFCIWILIKIIAYEQKFSVLNFMKIFSI